MSATFALLGSGEFEPWTETLERATLSRSPRPGGVVLVVPTASAHEGGGSFERWGAKGLEHYARLDIPAEVVDLRTRGDAERAEIVGRLDDASMVFLSGGNPSRLAGVLGGSAFWGALRGAIAGGIPYAGCSAGVAALTERTFDSDAQDLREVWKPGLALTRRTVFGPHWDMVDSWVPGATRFIRSSVRDGETFVGLDEDTAMLGDGERWTVFGRGAIHVGRDGRDASYRAGETFDLALDLAL